MAQTLPPLRAGASALLFGVPSVAMYVAITSGVPALSAAGVPMPVAWFAAGGPVFGLLLVMAAVAYARERRPWTVPALAERLRLRPMTRADWGWAGAALAVSSIAIGAVLALSHALASVTGLAPLTPTPAELQFEPLGPGEYWMLLAWIPFFVANILGEELLWRGIILPRQERAFGRHTWLVHSGFWLLFHLGFGPQMLVVTPIVVAQTYAVARRQNTTVGVVIHAALNGIGFLVVSLGGL
ncbi:lysostaphin resistance A-like protein [Haliangium sp.]|uniref:CPBP family intramembrane glutamic endopeptidase n=1 Tax=Haliangium sp. TaxID=2663208 RepID=UPI003D0F8B9C